MQTLFDVSFEIAFRSRAWPRRDLNLRKVKLVQLAELMEGLSLQQTDSAIVQFNQALGFFYRFALESSGHLHVFNEELASKLRKADLLIGARDFAEGLRDGITGAVNTSAHYIQVRDATYILLIDITNKSEVPGVCYKIEHTAVLKSGVLCPTAAFYFAYKKGIKELGFDFENGVLLESYLTGYSEGNNVAVKFRQCSARNDKCDLIQYIPKLVYYLLKSGNPDLRRYKPPVITTKKEKKAARQLGDQSAFEATHVGFGFGKDPLYLKDSWTYFRQQAHGPKFSDRKLIEITAHRRIGRE